MGSRGSSLIDYVIVSEDCLSHISDFYVSDPNILSDHCTVSLLFKIAFLKQRMRKLIFIKVMFKQNMYGIKVC